MADSYSTDMVLYKKESLELLRQKVDLTEILSAHLKMQRSGASYKSLCPFHEEKTPSFMVQRGDHHYHCFGCGAHGDAISFLMGYLKMSFTEAVEHLAERFQVVLEKTHEPQEYKGPSRAVMKEALERACFFYQQFLLHAEEGREALSYLYDRGIDLEFIEKFGVGFAPATPDLLPRFLREEGISDEVMAAAGLISRTGRDFFSERITFPIRDGLGSVIGFSARKFREETFGGKYINTTETPLFKKSRVLFGLSYSRKRIAKERRAIVVEGQIDALRLIAAGFNLTVAGLGTAFGEEHVHELSLLGVNHVFLAMDGDQAGREAAVKTGDHFQKKGIEVSVVQLPEGADPDSFLRERGVEPFTHLLKKAKDYLTFLYETLSLQLDVSSPSKKNELIKKIAEKVRSWEHPVMVHESLKKLVQLSGIPSEVLGVSASMPQVYVKRASAAGAMNVDPDRILEVDVLRWLILVGKTDPMLFDLVEKNRIQDHLQIPSCKRLYEICLETRPDDLFALAAHFDASDDPKLLEEIMGKKINLQKAREGCAETVRKLLLRSWMHACELIAEELQRGHLSDEEALEAAKKLADLKKNPPQVVEPIPVFEKC